MIKPPTRLAFAFLVVFTALLGATAFAQQAAPDVYVVVTYIKVLPGQDDAYRAYLTTTGKKIFQEQQAANPNFLFWSSAKTMFQGTEHGTDFDYVGASVFAGPPPEPSTLPDSLVQKAAGMTAADLAKKLATLRTIVGTEVLRQQATASVPGTLKEGDYRVAARVRVKPGMFDEYYEMGRTMTQPIAQARIAAGEAKSWSLWSRTFPAGAATSYDALAVTYFKDLASAIRGLDATKGLEAFQKVHPGKNYATYINNGRDYSELQQRILMQVVSLVERPR